MALDNPGIRVEKIATKAVFDGLPTVEKKIVGWANRTLQLGAYVDPSDEEAVRQIKVGESFVIMVGGEHEVPVSATTGHAPEGTVEGDLLYIRESNNAIVRNAAAAGTNEVQNYVVKATGGTSILSFDGESTGALAFNISAENLQKALEGLSNIQPGDVVVTGGPGNEAGSTPYVITFGGQYASENVPALEVDDGELTGGDEEGVISTTTPGVAPPGSMPLGVVTEVDATRKVALVNTNDRSPFLGG